MLSAILVVTTLLAPNQDAQGRRFTLDGPGALQFEIPTSTGTVRGSIPIEKLESRGLEGWGRFDFRLTLDASRVQTGDAVRDAFIAESVLLASEGPLYVASTERKSPAARTGQGKAANDEKWSLGGWMDPRRGRKYVAVPYVFTPNDAGTRARLEIEHVATLQDLGFKAPDHPFVVITGPITLRLTVDLVR